MRKTLGSFGSKFSPEELPPKRFHQFIAYNLDHLLPGCQAFQDFLPLSLDSNGSTNCLTTLKFTSASNKASRISFNASSTWAGVNLNSPRRFLKIFCKLLR